MQKTGILLAEKRSMIRWLSCLIGAILCLAVLTACGNGGENESAAATDPGQKLRREIVEGLKLVRENNYEAAMSKVYELINKDPNDAEAISVMSFVYVKAGRLKDASEYSQRALELDPYQSRPLIVQATVNFQRSQFENALDLARKALIINPKAPLAYKVIGEVYLRKGLIKDSLTVLKEAVKLEPNDPEILNLLGSSYIKNKQYDQALSTLFKTQKIDPNLPGVHLNLALVYTKFQDGKKAIKHINRAEHLYTQEENKPWMAKSRDIRRVIAKQFKLRPDDISGVKPQGQN